MHAARCLVTVNTVLGSSWESLLRRHRYISDWLHHKNLVVCVCVCVLIYQYLFIWGKMIIHEKRLRALRLFEADPCFLCNNFLRPVCFVHTYAERNKYFQSSSSKSVYSDERFFSGNGMFVRRMCPNLIRFVMSMFSSKGTGGSPVSHGEA